MRTLYLYAHTHWDREWYQPFESFRLQLVCVVRKVLDELDSGNLPKFYLDGQAIIFDDVLEIDPELRPRLEANMKAGKLYAGPWYVLADQMLVGGESLVRNLGMGIELTSRFGAPAMIGYCPDTFGHTADLPRILNGFGIKTAAVWRGVPALEMGPVFWWQSPDGSRVLSYHLTRGYYQTAFHEMQRTGNGGGGDGTNALADHLLGWVDSVGTGNIRPYYSEIDGALIPVGADHVGPPPRFSKVLKDLNKRFQKDGKQLQLVPTALPEFLNTITQSIGKPMKIVQSVDGELRSNRCAPYYERSYLLYGVLSARLYLKRANRLAEHKLVSICEPVYAMLNTLKLSDYPARQFEHAWKLLMKNHPHDSICGCSVDEVHDEMMTRYARLDDMLDTMLGQAEAVVAGSSEGEGISGGDPDFGCNRLAVFNTSASAIKMPVPLRFAAPLNSKNPAASADLQIDSKTKTDQLFSGWGSVPYYKEVDVIDAWVWPGELPDFGVKQIEWPLTGKTDETPAVSVRSHKLSNGVLDVNISNGGKITVSHMVPGESVRTYRINHALRDVGDGGDSYNFDPIPDDKPIYAKLIDVAAGKNGPLVGSVYLTYEIELPEAAAPDTNLLKRLAPDLGKIEVMKRSAKRIKHKVVTEITLKRGVPIVYFDTLFENEAADHRLEVVFDTEAPVRTTFSENHFSLITRQHGAKARHDKLPVPLAHEAFPDRFPCQRFFVANGQAFFNCGLPEYAVEGSEVSITLLRALSYLSRPRLWTRGGGAGPNVHVPGANCRGKNHVSYGWAPLRAAKSAPGGLSEEAAASVYHLADVYGAPVWAALSKDNRVPDGSLVSIDNQAIRIMAALANRGQLELRLLNVSKEPQKAGLRVKASTFSAVSETNLAGSPVRDLTLKKNVCSLQFGPNQLITVRLTIK